jgi:hypothetical protein
VRDHQQVRLRLRFGDEGADAGDPLEHAFLGQLAQRAIDRHARDAEARGEIELGWNALARAPFARRDVPANERLDLLERCGGLRDHRWILARRSDDASRRD